MNKQSTETEIRQRTDNNEKNNNLSDKQSQSKTVKMIRPFAEAEELEKQRRERKALEEVERANRMKNVEIKPKTVNMVRPFAEAEELEKQRRERKALEEVERENRMNNIERQPKTVNLVRPFAEGEELEKQRRERKALEEAELENRMKNIERQLNRSNIVRPFAEAEEAEKQRRERKALEEAERENRLKNIERQPKTVNMVRPFAEAEETEKQRRERKALEEVERENRMKNIEGQPKTVNLVRPFAEGEELEKQRRQRKALEEIERENRQRKALEEAERENRMKNIEKPVNMVRPFAEAEEAEKQRKERKAIEKESKSNENNISKNKVSINSNKVSNSDIQIEQITIPDQLNITIRTSIPGYQKIEYKPSMTIKDSDSKGVQFNPLIRLNKSTVEKIPLEYRTKQFLNKGLFNSLLIYNGGNKANTLQQATRSGYIDNNIKVTLDSIFPVNSVIYIGKQPYAIGDVQWTTGDWKIEVKQKKVELDPSKITDPYLYTQLVREEIVSGEEQLKNLPQSLIVGNNYSGPPPVASGPNAIIPPSNVNEINQNVPSSVTSKIIPSNSLSLTTTKQITNAPIINSQISSSQPKAIKNIPETTDIEKVSTIQYKNPEPQPKKMLALPAPEPNSSNVQEITPEEDKIFESLKGKYTINLERTKEIRNYFLETSYYNIVNIIYLGLPSYIKNDITNFYRLITMQKRDVISKSFSNTMYKTSCNQISIFNSVSDGDCFFVAVAYGINIYNSENPGEKFYYQNYGKTQLYTSTILREIVLKYYESLDEERKRNFSMIIGTANVDNLNSKFKKSIEDNPPSTDDEYMERLEIIYKSDENFFVYKPDRKPIYIDDEKAPFRILEEHQISNYIRSKNYWGDQFAIEAICNILKIYIIPIDSVGPRNNIKLFATPVEPDVIKNICSKNIMFLYRKNLHYELIKIKYKRQVQSKSNMLIKLTSVDKNFTIFRKGDFPPLFQILVLIYGSNYITAGDDLRRNYGLYPQYMASIEESIRKILELQSPQSRIFVNLFTEKFKLNKTLDFYIKRQSKDEDRESTKTNLSKPTNYALTKSDNLYSGGAFNQQQYGYPRYNYNQQYDSKNITKKPEELDSSKIAYEIIIDMELHQGKSLTPEQINESKCNSRYNAIRKAFSEFTGRPYVIQPVYKTTQTKKNIGGKYNRNTRKRY